MLVNGLCRFQVTIDNPNGTYLHLALNTYLYESLQCCSCCQYTFHRHLQRRLCTAVHRVDQISGRWCCWCYRTTGGPLHSQPQPCRRRNPARPATTPRCCLSHRKSRPSAGSEDRELQECQKSGESKHGSWQSVCISMYAYIEYGMFITVIVFDQVNGWIGSSYLCWFCSSLGLGWGSSVPVHWHSLCSSLHSADCWYCRKRRWWSRSARVWLQRHWPRRCSIGCHCQGSKTPLPR